MPPKARRPAGPAGPHPDERLTTDPHGGGGAEAPRAGVTHRRIWRIAGPIILSNVSVPLLGAVDTAVVGHLDSPTYLGGVAVGALIFNYVYWAFIFLRMGTTGLVAQAYGRGDGAALWAIRTRALLFAAGLSLVVIALQAPLLAAARALIEASAEVEALAGTYFLIRVWAAPAALANLAMLGWLIGVQRAGAALALQVFMNGLNIVLDLVFVVGLGWDVDGVALASLLSEYASGVLGLALCVRVGRRVGARRDLAALRDVTQFRRLASLNGDIFVRTLFVISTFAVFTALGARMGDTLLAANALLLNFMLFLSHALDGFAHAASALVGSAAGVRDRAGFRRVVGATTGWAAAAAVLFAVVYGVAGRTIIDLLTGLEEVRAVSYGFLPWLVAAPLIAVWSFQLDGVYIGATETRLMRNTMALAFAAFVLALSALVPAFGNHGLWAAFLVFLAARGVLLGALYPRIEARVGAGST
jgi:MATE family multidrug resistance protein